MINKIELKEFVRANPKLVKIKETCLPNRFILKYDRSVFYKGNWNEFLQNCRGTVIDSDFNVIVAPPKKVFNFMEQGTKIHRDELCIWHKKINGFMACATIDPVTDKMIISTTGSLDSDFVGYAKEYLNDYEDVIRSAVGGTLLFEICHPLDPHIIPEKFGAYLIGYRKNNWEDQVFDSAYFTVLQLFAEQTKFKQAEFGWDQFDNIIEASRKIDFEGYMVYGQTSGTVLKLKSPYYLCSKLFSRMGVDKLDHILKHPDWATNGMMKNVDEEYFPLVNYLAKNKDLFLPMDEQKKVSYCRAFIEKEILE
jgi:hypothetical protein